MDTNTDVTVTAIELIGQGPSYRQIHYWYRAGYIIPENPHCGSGGDVLVFSAEQADMAVKIWRFARAGIPPATAHRAILNNGNIGYGVRITINSVPEHDALAEYAMT